MDDLFFLPNYCGLSDLSDRSDIGLQLLTSSFVDQPICPNDISCIDPLDQILNPDYAPQFYDPSSFPLFPDHLDGSPTTAAAITDIFGTTRLCDPFDVDIMSGLPSTFFPHDTIQHEKNVAKLNKNDNLVSERDIAVEHYHEALDHDNYEEAAKWERIANDKQRDLFDLWDTPLYTNRVRATGL